MAREISSKRISPIELTKAYLQRVELLNPILNAYLTVVPEHALQQARHAEEAIMQGNYRGTLHGVPIALKDLFDTDGILTTAGSKIFKDRVPGSDSHVVSRLNKAGTILLGKLNMHEFAFGVTNVNPHYGPARNPWGTDRITGGSSGGSGAAVGAGLCAGALGTDTGGSIRIPACFCGIVGLKPTYGRVSKRGVFPLSWSLDHVGPMTRTVEDAAIILQEIAGYDPEDENSKNVPVPNYLETLKHPINGIRIGILSGDYLGPIDNEVKTALDKVIFTLNHLGVVIFDNLELPFIEEALNPSITIMSTEAAEYHKDNLAKRPYDYSENIFNRLMSGLGTSRTAYIDAKQVQRSIHQMLLKKMQDLDAIFLPMLPLEAPTIGEEQVMVSGRTLDLRSAVTRLTQPFNLTGFPAISIPCGFTSSGFPIGFQLVAKPFQEEKLLMVGHAYEQENQWFTKHPTL
jgi:aspartyl-tRNA(Asn)/glutamyl-tRNA(Gln) amidotransferase subunit A